MNKFKKYIINLGRKILTIFLQREMYVLNQDIDWDYIKLNLIESKVGKNVKIYKPSFINKAEIGDFTYISTNAYISVTHIGKFCSIGPNLLCGWGIHPIEGISTSPMFYSTRKQNGLSLTDKVKIEERKLITIGNDVFIGSNVTILDGITIGDGVIIGAGAVVSKDIPDYAIAVGCPIKIIKYRFAKKSLNKTSNKLTIPKSITIGGFTYKITAIAPSSFKSCKKIKTVVIGKNVESIEKNAFADCKKLKKITIKSNNLKTVGKNAIKGINKKTTIKVPKKKLSSYRKLFTSRTGFKKTMKIKK